MSEFWSPSPHRPLPPNRFFLKQASSAAHIYGKQIVGAESFTTIGPHWNDELWHNQKSAFDHGSWRMFWNYGGGLMTDWGVHLLDMVLWGMNIKTMPKRVAAVGGKFAFPDNCPETFDTQSVIYEFDSFLMHWSHTGGVETGPYNRNYGMAFKGTNGTLVADRNNWEVIPEYDGNKKPRVETTKVVSDDSDHRLHVANQYEEGVSASSAASNKYVCKRPPLAKRQFTSEAVENAITTTKAKLTDQKLAWQFENCFPNTLDTTWVTK